MATVLLQKMKKMKKIFLLVIVCGILGLPGCSRINQNEKSVLNERNSVEEDKAELNTSDDISNNTMDYSTDNETNNKELENIPDTTYDFQYNPYVLSKEFLIKYGEEYYDFYKSFVDAYLNYETSCPCPNEEYSYEVDFLMDSSFLMFQSDAFFDIENMYDEKTQTVHWNYISKTKEEHDKKIEEFKEQVATYMKCLQKDDSDFEKAIALYGELNSRTKYDGEVEDVTPYHALMEGTGICTSFSGAYCYLLLEAGVDAITNGGYSVKSGGHAWDIVRLNNIDYFMDPTYEVGSKGSDGKGLMYFGMSMEEREEIGGFDIKSSHYGSVNDLNTVDYINSDNQFSTFRNCIDFVIDRERGCIVYHNSGEVEAKEFYYENGN